MILRLHSRLEEAVRGAVRSAFGADLPAVSFQYPPRLELGDLALTAPFDLARSLRKPPREIAARLATDLAASPDVLRADVAGGGYVNLFLRRGRIARELLDSLEHPAPGPLAEGRVIVEHTSINPNKAAHIGHLRNAALGDTFVRVLGYRGREVGVQNYIDDTGVQVADVVVGFQHLEQKAIAEVEALASRPRFDYYCWDLYARVGDFYAAAPGNRALQARTLHAIEEGGNETARLAAVVAASIVDAHLATMERLGIRYDLLAHESDILRLHFWDRAFAKLKESGAIRLETEGKSAGCWVLTMGGDGAGPPLSGVLLSGAPSAEAASADVAPATPADRNRGEARRIHSGARSGGSGGGGAAPPSSTNDEDKVIVRSNGTVTYTGKDIAYQLWKLGLLGLDFRYRRHRSYPDGHLLWTTTSGEGESGAPAFGHAREVYNVIDVGQSYPQRVVKAAVAALGHAEGAEGTHHLAYEKVVLSPATARALGYEVAAEETVVKVSGRKGQGVKADDLLDALLAKAREEIEARDPERALEARDRAAVAIATGALRYFLLKFGRTKIITFDMEEALAFTGETGPYVQNGIVRARNIFSKLEEEGNPVTALLARARTLDLDHYLAGDTVGGTAASSSGEERRIHSGATSGGSGGGGAAPSSSEGAEVWSLLLLMARTDEVADQAIRAEEVSLLARHAFAVAQAFHSWYQKGYSVLHAEDDETRALRTQVVDAFLRQMAVLTDLLGIPVPERM